MSIRSLSFSKLSLFAAALFFAMGATPSHADDEFQRIQNKWKPKEFIHVEHGEVEAGTIKPGWWSAQWKVVEVDGFVRFENKFKPGEFLHIQNGELELGRIKPGWWSAMWTLDEAQEESVRICNRWKEGICLHIQNGELEAGEVEDGWWSAMWFLKDVD